MSFDLNTIDNTYAASALRLWAYGDKTAPLPAYAPFLASTDIFTLSPEILSLNYDCSSLRNLTTRHRDLSHAATASILEGIFFMQNNDWIVLDESGRSCGYAVPLLQPTDKLRHILQSLSDEIFTSPVFIEWIKASAFKLEPLPEHWMTMWYLGAYLRPHHQAFVRRLATALSTNEFVESPSRICQYVSYILRVTLFSGETDLPQMILGLVARVLEISERTQTSEEIQRVKYFRLFCESYFSRRVLDSPDLCRQMLDEARQIVKNCPEIFSTFEKHQILHEETSISFQEDNWIIAKTYVLDMELRLLNAISPDKAALVGKDRKYSDEDIAWEDIVPLSHQLAPCVADVLFLRSFIDRVSIGGYSQHAYRSSLRTINFCMLLFCVVSGSFTHLLPLSRHQAVWSRSSQNAIAHTNARLTAFFVQRGTI